MANFSYETTEKNALYCVENEDIKGMVIYRFTKPDYVFNREIEIVRNVFDSHGIKYEEMATIDERHGAGYTFVIERGWFSLTMTMDILIKILLVVIVISVVSIKTMISNKNISDEVKGMKKQLEADEELLQEHIKDFERVLEEVKEREE